MPSYQGVALMEKATSSKEAAILVCNEHHVGFVEV
jgi:hypothetical protein